MDWRSLLTPWNIGGGLFGLLLGMATLVSLIANRRLIGTTFVKVTQRLFSPIGFFGLVIVVFMTKSVLESGQFQAGTSDAAILAQIREICGTRDVLILHSSEAMNRFASLFPSSRFILLATSFPLMVVLFRIVKNLF